MYKNNYTVWVRLRLFNLFNCKFISFLFYLDFIYFQREVKGGQKRGRERECAIETSISRLSHAPNWGPPSTSQALPGNRTASHLVYGMTPRPLNHTNQGSLYYLLKIMAVALAGVAQWIVCGPVNQRVPGLIPSLGTCLGCRPGPQLGACEGQPYIDVSLPLFLLSSPLSKKK